MERSSSNPWSCPSSDSEFYSVSSPDTVSPAPSVDRGFSPTHRLTCSKSGDPPAIEKKRRPRLKNPSEQRQNASEKEKLRMRDLTKALHHLRTYLPPSVAPVGQTLTKIETLRLTIRYISFLTAQLGLGEEELTHGKQSPRSPEMFGCFQSTAGRRSEPGQRQGGDGSGHAGQCAEMNVDQYDGYAEQNFSANFLQPQQQTYQVTKRFSN